MEQIFIQKISSNQRKNFCFGGAQDQYLAQMKDFMESNGINTIIHAVNSLLEEEAWIPVRYNEIKKVHEERSGI